MLFVIFLLMCMLQIFWSTQYWRIYYKTGREDIFHFLLAKIFVIIWYYLTNILWKRKHLTIKWRGIFFCLFLPPFLQVPLDLHYLTWSYLQLNHRQNYLLFLDSIQILIPLCCNIFLCSPGIFFTDRVFCIK